MRATLLCVLIVLVSGGSLARAQCGGNGGNADLVSDPLVIGTTVTLTTSGAAGAAYGLFFSDSVAPAVIPPYGPVCLNLGSALFQTILQGVLPPAGSVPLAVPVPNDPGLLPFAWYLQAAASDAGHPSGLAISPALRVDLEVGDSYVTLSSLAGSRALATTSLMGDGRVLKAGGGNGTLLAPVATDAVEIYDPVLRTLSSAPAMSIPRALHTATTLDDGRVLVAGGVIDPTGTMTATCEIFDPATGQWITAASMGGVRGAHAATLLGNGHVLVVGGTVTFMGGGSSIGPLLNMSLDTGECYDPAADAWTPAANVMASKRFLPTMITLADGRALAISGMNGATSVFGQDIPTWTETCNVFDPVTGMFGAAPSLSASSARAAAAAALMPNGDVWVAGGAVPGLLLSIPTATDTTLTFDGSSWSAGPALPTGVVLPGIAPMASGNVFVCGGVTGTLLAPMATANAVVYDGALVAPVTSMPAARGAHGVVGLKDGGIWIGGGGDAAGAAQADAWLYTPNP